MKYQDFSIFSLLIFLSFLFHYPHLISYQSDTNFDFYLHYNWAKEFSESVMLGDIYPRWIYHGRFGLGEPTFLYYAPLYYWLTSFFSLFSHSTWVSMHIVEILTGAIFSWFIYKSLSYYTALHFSIFAGIAALFNPFLVMLHYKFNGFAWAATGFACLGLLLWSVMRPNAQGKFINCWAALAIGLAVLSHTVSALVYLICFSFLCLIPCPSGNVVTWRSFIRPVLGWMVTVFIGLALSAVYLLPALTSMEWISASAWIQPLTLQSFSFPLFSAYKYGVGWFGFQWPISILIALTVIVPSIYFMRRQMITDAEKVYRTRIAMVLGLVALFFASELSYLLWLMKTPLQMVTLPYRFMCVACVAGIVLCSLALDKDRQFQSQIWRKGLLIPIILSILAAVIILVKGAYWDGSNLPRELRDNQYTYQPFKESFIKSGFDGRCTDEIRECIEFSWRAGGFRGVPEYVLKTQGADWLKYAKDGLNVECGVNSLQCQELSRTYQGRHWQIESPNVVKLRLPQFDFPAWQVYLDRQLVNHRTDLKTGLIVVELPRGQHEVSVRWKRLPNEKLGFWISVASSIILIILALWIMISRMISKINN